MANRLTLYHFCGSIIVESYKQKMKQIYIFGYGSLASKTDAARTLGRPIYSTRLVTLRGWVRDWSTVVNNKYSKHYQLSKTHKIPDSVLALNIHKPIGNEKPLNPNGVLIRVDDKELSKLDSRESNYDRVDVTNDVIGKPINSTIYTYVCKPEHLDTRKKHPIIPSSYLHLVLESFKTISPNALSVYLRTTKPSRAKVLSTIRV